MSITSSGLKVLVIDDSNTIRRSAEIFLKQGGHEVLLAEEDYTVGEYGEGLPMNYLARTAFGLVGWLRLTKDDVHNSNPVLRGLGYMGD